MNHRPVTMLLLLALGPLCAVADVVDRHRIDRVEVAGLTLETDARQAFETLKSRGFDTGNLQAYEDWWHAGLTAVKGDRNAPEGHTEIILTRNGNRLVEIREHLIRLRVPFDVVAETEAKRRHFGLGDDAGDCKTSPNQKSASCGVEDADKTAVYLLMFNGDRQRYSTVQRLDLRPAENQRLRPASR